MKKLIALLLVTALLTCMLCACGKKPPEPVAGGWNVNSEFGKAELPEEAQAAFDAAAANYDGEELTPVAFLGTQVVAGLNFKYLCKTGSGLAVVTVYRDLEQNAEVTSVSDVAVSGLTEEAPAVQFDPADFAGGWSCEEACGGALGEDAQSAFDKAFEGFAGVGYQPLAVLGTQVVAGCNYAILAKATAVTAEPCSALAVVYVYADLQGGAEILGITGFEG